MSSPTDGLKKVSPLTPSIKLPWEVLMEVQFALEDRERRLTKQRKELALLSHPDRKLRQGSIERQLGRIATATTEIKAVLTRGGF